MDFVRLANLTYTFGLLQEMQCSISIFVDLAHSERYGDVNMQAMLDTERATVDLKIAPP